MESSAIVERKCYAVDLDATLAEYHGWKKHAPIGEPVPRMVRNIEKWLDKGIEIVIFTARAGRSGEVKKIQHWLMMHGLPTLEVTNIKEPRFQKILDDRAYRVEANTGKLIEEDMERR